MKIKLTLEPQDVSDVLEAYVASRGCEYIGHDMLADGSIEVTATFALAPGVANVPSLADAAASVATAAAAVTAATAALSSTPAASPPPAADAPPVPANPQLALSDLRHSDNEAGDGPWKSTPGTRVPERHHPKEVTPLDELAAILRANEDLKKPGA